jgi:hypothetical protein
MCHATYLRKGVAVQAEILLCQTVSKLPILVGLCGEAARHGELWCVVCAWLGGTGLTREAFPGRCFDR